MQRRCDRFKLTMRPRVPLRRIAGRPHGGPYAENVHVERKIHSTAKPSIRQDRWGERAWGVAFGVIRLPGANLHGTPGSSGSGSDRLALSH